MFQIKPRHLGPIAIAMMFVVSSPGIALAEPVGTAEAGQFSQNFDSAALDSYIEEARIAWRTPGIAVAVIIDGEIAYMKGFGQRDVARKLPVSPDTLFVGASTTKAFTAASVAMMVEQGTFSWDTPVRNYLPSFVTANDAATGQITLRDMLSHRTGLPRHDLMWYNNSALSRAQLLDRLPFLAMSKPLRSEWQYNNIMYMLAGHAVELQAGRAWETFVTDRLLQPLGMGRTNFSVRQMLQDGNAAHAYKLDADRRVIEIPLRPVDFIGPAGSINSSVRDYANWARFQLTGQTPDGQQLLPPNLLQDMHSAIIPIGGKPEFADFSPMFYGMGWFVDTYRGMNRVQHGGNLDGFTALVTLYPDQRSGSVVFVNLEASPLPGFLSLDIMDRIMHLEPRDWSRNMLSRRDIGEKALDEGKARIDETRRAEAPPAHAILEYVGTFTNPGYGALTISLFDGDQLVGTFNDIEFALAPWHFEYFRSKARKPGDDGFDDMLFQFITDRRGRVSGVEAELQSGVPPIRFERSADPNQNSPEQLSRYVGQYVLRDQLIEVELVGGRLLLTVPGQTPYWLEALPGGDFGLEGVSSIEVRFVGDGAKPDLIRFFQPNGVFDAARATPGDLPGASTQ